MKPIYIFQCDFWDAYGGGAVNENKGLKEDKKATLFI